MQSILVATDFSERSDRAVRKAARLAKACRCRLVLLHVVDDDRPYRLLEIEQEAALLLLQETAQMLVEEDIGVELLVRKGAPFVVVADMAIEIAATLILIGASRRQLLKDVFVGTTAERIMRQSAVPVLMVNREPALPYHHALIAVDMSDASVRIVETAVRLGLDRHMAVSVIYLFHAQATGLLIRSPAPMEEIRKYQDQEAEKAGTALRRFLKNTGIASVDLIARQSAGPIAGSICAAAEELTSDLIVIGTHGKSSITRVLLGSIAEDVLRTARQDVLVVPTILPD